MDAVLRHTSWRRIQHTIYTIPLVAKHSIAHSLALALLLASIGPDVHRPVWGILGIWFAAFSFGLIAASMLPYRRRQAHWLQAVVDDRNEKLYWE